MELGPQEDIGKHWVFNYEERSLIRVFFCLSEVHFTAFDRGRHAHHIPLQDYHVETRSSVRYNHSFGFEYHHKYKHLIVRRNSPTWQPNHQAVRFRVARKIESVEVGLAGSRMTPEHCDKRTQHSTAAVWRMLMRWGVTAHTDSSSWISTHSFVTKNISPLLSALLESTKNCVSYVMRCTVAVLMQHLESQFSIA